MHVGRHCCLWCEIATDKLKVPLHTRGYSHPRSHATLKYDHQRFVQNGANVKQVKLYNNVVHQYLCGKYPLIRYANNSCIYTVIHLKCIDVATIRICRCAYQLSTSAWECSTGSTLFYSRQLTQWRERRVTAGSWMGALLNTTPPFSRR